MVDTEVTQCSTKKDRCQFACQEAFQIEFVAGALHQLKGIAQLFGVISAYCSIQLGIVQSLDLAHVLHGVALPGFVQHRGVAQQVVDPLETFAHADGPGDRRALDIEHVLDFIQHLDTVTDIPVELVDKGKNRRIPQTTDFHQFDGSLFYPLAASITIKAESTAVRVR